ncbi:MAG: ABC transporter permease [Acidobacteriota bacterium]
MNIWQDVRFSARMLVKDRWYTAVAVLALALGIGVNSTVFTFVNAVLLRGLPYPESDRIVALTSTNLAEGQNTISVSYPDYEDWRGQQRTFQDLAAMRVGTMNVSDANRPAERTDGVYVSANLFRLLGQAMKLGRNFTEADDQPGAPSVAILGYGIWQSRYGGKPDVLGRTIRVNEVPTVVIGIMPEGVQFPNIAEMWQPLVQAPAMLTASADRPNEGKDRWRRSARSLGIIGRLRPGVTLAQAQTDITAIAERLEKQYPDSNKGISAHVMTYNERVNGGPIKVVFLLLMGAVSFVLLIACANVANLLLARSTQRTREMAVRLSLGAGRWQLTRQLLIESIMLGLVSGIFGLALSIIGVRLFDAAVANSGKPYWIQFTIDGTVLSFLVAICVATGVLFGLAPALHVARTNTSEILKETGRSGGAGVRAQRFTAAMVVFEIALTIVLLVGAGLMVRSFFKLYALDLGIRLDKLLVARTVLPERKYPGSAERVIFYDRLLARTASMPGAASVALTTNPPLSGGGNPRLFIDGHRVDDAKRAPRVTAVQVSDNYFDAVQMSIRRGRAFGPRDGTAGAESAIVNERFAAQFFPNEDVLGRRIRLADESPEAAAPWLTIVGIVQTVRQDNIMEADPDPVVFTPLRREPPRGFAIVARTSGDPGALANPLREAMREVDPDQPLFRVTTMNDAMAQARWPWRVFGSMFAIFALIALVLSAVGIYAVTAYSVVQRTQEIGIRMALGAQNNAVSWLILRRGLIQLGIGLAIGLGGSFFAARLLKSIIVQTSPQDPVTFASITILLVVITAAACLVPTRRAVRLDPVRALRAD